MHGPGLPLPQAIFEGMKAQRSAKDRIVLFRPDANADRMIEGRWEHGMDPHVDLHSMQFCGSACRYLSACTAANQL